MVATGANPIPQIADFEKIALVTKKAAETQYWCELFEGADLGDTEVRRELLKESSELLAIFTTIGKTTKSRG